MTGAELCERLFQSTPPVRGATAADAHSTPWGCYFNPRPPRGGRQKELPLRLPRQHFNPRPREGGDSQTLGRYPGAATISIHAPREGGRHRWNTWPRRACYFNPRPREGGDIPEQVAISYWDISIHAPRKGGDPPRAVRPTRQIDFNPRPPRGGRRIHLPITFGISVFQSTPPARGATTRHHGHQHDRHISIHAPREGGDCMRSDCRCCQPYFNPRPPRGGRLHTLRIPQGRHNFNPRPPRGGRQQLRHQLVQERRDFNPRPPRGGRHARHSGWCIRCRISIHAPREGGDSMARSSSSSFLPFQSTPPARGATS